MGYANETSYRRRRRAQKHAEHGDEQARGRTHPALKDYDRMVETQGRTRSAARQQHEATEWADLRKFF